MCALIVMISLLSLPCTGQSLQLDTLKVDGNSSFSSINKFLRVFHGPTELSAEAAWFSIITDKLEETDKKTNPGMSFPDDGYWAVLLLQNSDPRERTYFLEVDYPQLDYLALYAITEGKPLRLWETGDRFTFEHRPVVARNFALPISLAENETKTFLIHLEKTKSTMRYPMGLYSESAYTTHHFTDNLTYSLYFGLICMISLASLLLGIILRQKVFLAYSFYLVGFMLWFFTRLGYPYQLFISNYPDLNRFLLPVTANIAVVGLVLYAMQLFRSKELLPKYHKVMIGVLSIIIGGFVPWALFPDEHIAYAPYLFAIKYTLLFVTIIFIFTAAYEFRKVDRFRSNMFILAYSLFLLSIASKILAEFGLINESVFLIDPILVGFFFEAVVLTVTMSILLKRMLKKADSRDVPHPSGAESHYSQYLTLNSKATLPVDQIAFIQSDDHYLEFNLITGKKEIDRNTLSQAMSALPSHFVQTHRSFIVNLNQVKATFSDKLLLHNGKEVRVSRTYKEKIHMLVNNQLTD